MEKAAYELGRAEAEKKLAVVNEELKVIKNELAEVEWSLRVTTKELDEVFVLRPGRMVEQERELELWRSGQSRIVYPPILEQAAQVGKENESGTTPEFDLSHSDERITGDAMTGIEQDGFEEPQPSNNEACETGNRMTGVEEDAPGQTKLPDDDDSDIGDEVPDSSIYNASEAGDVVMGNVNDEGVSYTPSLPDVADSDLKGLIDELADRIEHLNIGRDLPDMPVPSLVRHDGLARGLSPYWAMVNNPPYGNYGPSSNNGWWSSKVVEEEEEL